MVYRFMLTQKRITSRGNCKGFTLVELMIAMAISGVVFMAAFKIFTNHQQQYAAQLDVTEMQQNIRVALNLLSRDIRMAGYEDEVEGSGTAKIVKATSDLFYFTVDLNENGDVSDAGEHIAYDQYISTSTQTPTLGRTVASTTITVTQNASGRWAAAGNLPAAENIDRLEFFYLDKDGAPLTPPGIESQIQTVVISILARADQPDPKFTNNRTYNPASNLSEYNSGTLSGGWTVNDNFRRRLQIMRVDCRNMGL